MIRSLTIGLPVGDQSESKIESAASRLIEVSKKAFKENELAARTVRYSLPPFGLDGESEGFIISILNWVDRLADETGVRWFCLPLDFVGDGSRSERLSVSLNAITRFRKMFLNLMVADKSNLSIGAIGDAAKLISQISQKSNSGFDNFRVGASCGCPPNAPFFPFSHHKGKSVAFSFALELTDMANNLLNRLGKNVKVDCFRDHLVEEMSVSLRKIHELGEQIESESSCQYKGLDASFAPFPNGETSVARIVEGLLGAPIGSHGSVFVTGLLTDAIRAALVQSAVPSVGFNGVMFSLLEDDALASANSRRCLSLDGLMALSSMCGCGIDMVPVPGASFPEEIAALIMDIAAMSLSLKKPLGVRVLPIPGGMANEHTEFNFDFLCDSRIVGLSSNERSMLSDKNLFGLSAPSRL
jgi:uncharacterized protein